jgi:hypothetical protein
MTFESHLENQEPDQSKPDFDSFADAIHHVMKRRWQADGETGKTGEDSRFKTARAIPDPFH